MKRKGYAVYIHIPFCIRKCNYCDFLSVPWEAGKAEGYLEDLLMEIAQADWSGVKDITNIFIGGGTPSILSAESIGRILEALRAQRPFAFGIEVSMEANPGTVSLDQLKALRAMGVNRISLGAQSFRPEMLNRLGRIHGEGEIEQAAKMIVEAGFENWNLDLMFDLPGQTLAHMEANIQKAIDLDPSHISFYSLIVEPGTPFYEDWENGRLPIASEEGNRAMYHHGRSLLESHGYIQYEISNFAKAGRACRQNLTYWRRRPYLGFGLGAASFEFDSRYVNPREFEVYHNRVKSGSVVRELEETMDQKAALAETMILGLRLSSGLSLSRLERKFPVEFPKIQPIIQEQVDKDLLVQFNGRILLSVRGMDLANQVMMEFMG